MRTRQKPPAPQHSIFWETGFFRIRHYRNSEKNFNFFLFLRLTILRVGFIF